MKTKKFTPYVLILLMAFSISCSKTENADVEQTTPGPEPDPTESIVYDISAVNASGVTGTATLFRNTDGSSTIYIRLQNAESGKHPAIVHFGSIEAPGDLAITLNDCECAVSETVITKFDNGQPISYDDLSSGAFFINIYQSQADPNNIIANTNIGSSAF